MTSNPLFSIQPLQSVHNNSETPAPIQANIVTFNSKVFILRTIIECMVDGILILAENGHILHRNASAKQICAQLIASSQYQNSQQLPEQIWQVCKFLIESRQDLSNQNIIIEDEIPTANPVPIRVRARWLEIATEPHPCILVTLEDSYQLAQERATIESWRYGLTEREADVWQLRRTNHTYGEIAEQLYIAHDTVKKHMKSIYAKRQDVMNSLEDDK